MSTPELPVLRDVRRGRDPGEVELIDERGHIVLVHAHGIDASEKFRTRERALALLRPLVPEPAR
jgi:hypothetical protein